jgi:hypothetical protein
MTAFVGFVCVAVIVSGYFYQLYRARQGHYHVPDDEPAEGAERSTRPADNGWETNGSAVPRHEGDRS